MTLRIYLLLVLLPHCLNAYSINYNHKDSHEQLVAFYKTWRAFEQPPLINGAPDYTQGTFVSRMTAFKKLKGQLLSMDTTGWTIEKQVRDIFKK